MTRALIGIAGQTVQLSNRIREYNRITNKAGIYVFEIMKINALNHRKIRYGDIIVKFNDKNVETIDGLFKYLMEETIGTPVQLGLLRQGKLVYELIIPEPSSN